MTLKGWFYADYHYVRFVVLAAWCLPVSLAFVLHGDIYQWLLLGGLVISVNAVQWLDIIVPKFVRWRRRAKGLGVVGIPWWWFNNVVYWARTGRYYLAELDSNTIKEIVNDRYNKG